MSAVIVALWAAASVWVIWVALVRAWLRHREERLREWQRTTAGYPYPVDHVPPPV